MHYEVLVQLKKEVLDPQGRAIHETLVRLGHDAVKSVEVSKRYVINVDAGDESKGRELAEKLAREYLANPVAETFSVRRL